MAIKNRKLFVMQNFLGLDKENKPLKVAPFRASDGYNFEIDSQTLKTREGFVVDSYIEADLPANKSVIDWQEYKGGFFYVTEDSFYTVYNGVTKNLKEGTNVIQAGISTLDNTGKRPIFKEEKNALFIFGLDSVLVFSILYNADGTIAKYVLYDLQSKPESGLSDDDFNYQTYIDLPIAYEPTLFIGDNPLDDVNLLSKVSKYRLFANQETEQGFVNYTLPTHFDPDKHGNAETIENNVEITFYKNAYKNLSVFPVFLGIDEENFDYVSGTQGAILTGYGDNNNNIDISDTFFPKQDFEYFKDYTNEPATIGDVITNIVGLTKIDFFNLRVSSTGQSAFQYALDIIEQSTITANQVIKFNLPIEYTVNYRDLNDKQIIRERQVERATVVVYVQLRLDETTIGYSSATTNLLSGTEQDVLATNTDDYPTYPTQTGSQTHTITITNPIQSTISNLQTAVITAWQNQLEANLSSYSADDTVLLQAKAYYPYTQTTQEYVNVLDIDADVAYAEQDENGNPIQEYPSYPTNFSNPNNLPVIDVDDNWSHQDFYAPINWSLVENDLDFHLSGVVNTLFSTNNGSAFIRYQFTYDAGLLGTIYVSAVAKVEFQKRIVEERQKRNSFTSVVTIGSGGGFSGGLYGFKFNPEKNWFELSVREYFFDYNKEPSIEVKVTFESIQEEYSIISKSTFGTFFGSEDRLFLAGHPEYPNIDRYNVSNDLLGDNVVNQSYELSYFPSKNYRVLGGKGAINGYVVATDTQLYITKEEYPNDSKLFIRERVLNENGLAGYNEYKTSITETPLNNRCVVRFYNDILMLTKNGLYGVEISSNVLTNERLLKLRSGFINKHLKAVIASENKDNIYIVENNQMMYIFVGKNVFVADSRYISRNENSQIENLSYEIVKWIVQENYSIAKFKDNVLYAIAKNSEVKLKLTEDTDEDFVSSYIDNVFTSANFSGGSTGFTENYLQLSGDYGSTTYTDFSKSSIFVTQENSATQIIAKQGSNVDYTYNDNSLSGGVATFSIVNTPDEDKNDRFAKLKIGDVIHFIKSDGTRFGGTHTIKTVSTAGTFTVNTTLTEAQLDVASNIAKIGVDVSKKDLYPVIAIKDGTNYYFRYAFYKPETVYKFDNASQSSELQSQLTSTYDYLEIIFHPNVATDGIISIREPIVFLWQSAMTDFGSRMMEKTMFRANIYGTKTSTSNDLYFGYKTMRRFRTLTDSYNVPFSYDLNPNIANLTSLEDLDFNLFSINTFEEFGMSFPLKENNFLYIQFLVKASGRVQLNAFDVLYKDNRTLKSVG